VLGDIVLLDLGRRRGIRDIVWSPAHQAYLIAAGPKKDDPDHPNFALFKWKGGKDGRLEEIAAFASVMMANPDFHLEAVMPLKERRDAKLVDTKQVLLISDDGSRLVGGDECKKLDATKQSFRAVIRTIE